MSLSSEIAPHLPRLRRFSRALSGNQESGDAYVVALLEAIVADPSSFDRTVPTRIAVYSAFVRIWNSIALDCAPSPSESTLRIAADRLLTSITPVPRQAFLLVAMEGFSPDEAALVLSMSTDKLAQLARMAGQEIAEETGADVLIIEDEPLVAMHLESLVEDLGHRVMGIARTEAQAVALARAYSPCLILADIHLADGNSGLSAVRQILSMIDVPIVFVTAFLDRLVTGERPEATFLLTKPFDPETAKAVISQALLFMPCRGLAREKIIAGALVRGSVN